MTEMLKERGGREIVLTIIVVTTHSISRSLKSRRVTVLVFWWPRLVKMVMIEATK